MAHKTVSDKILAPNDLRLIQVSAVIDDISSPEVQNDIKTIISVAHGEQGEKSKPILVGLAAPQIGILKRIIAVDIKADGKGHVGNLRLYINPEIVWKSAETNDWYEGCFSTDRVCGIVSRPTKIKIRALTLDGQPVEEEHEGYVARIFQHEIDHLDGKEFVTHIMDYNNLHWVEDDEFPRYRNNEGWRNWPNKCSRETWERIKGIKKS